MIYEWIEHNDWEGETWTFFIDIEDDESLKVVFNSLIDKFKKIPDLKDVYELKLSKKTKDQCILLDKESNQDDCYYPEYVMKKTKDFPRFSLLMEQLTDSDNIEKTGFGLVDNLAYKMQIFDELKKK